jgi:hypothetical protein
MDRLTQLWKETLSGVPRLVLLAGEPGIGKNPPGRRAGQGRAR